MTKRTFLGTLLSFAAFSLVWRGDRVASFFNRLAVAPLSDHEIKTAALIAEYFYPEDDDPGALSLGVGTYIANRCPEPYFRRYRAALRRIVAFVDAESRRTARNVFDRLDGPSRTTVLDHIASGNADRAWPGIRRDFFTLLDATIEGCFCDPMHGGNRDALAWRLFGGSVKRDWFNG